MRIDLQAQAYDVQKKGDVRRMRQEGKIPGILYGHKDKPKRVYLNEKEFKKVIDVMKNEAVTINLMLENKPYTCLIKAIQHNPITNKLLHVDFQHIQKKEKIKLNIPIHLHGEAPGIKKGGVLDQHLHEVMVKCLPDDIPSRIDIDVSQLDLNGTIHIRDLNLPNIEFEVKPETSIVSVLVPKIEKEAPKPVTEGEAAPGEETAPAEGEVEKGVEKGKEEKGKEEKGKEEKPGKEDKARKEPAAKSK